MEEISYITAYLPSRLKKATENMPAETRKITDEIRLRKNGVFSVFAGGKNLFPDENGRLRRIENAITVTKEEMEECVFLLCKGSMYSFDDSIRRGFIPIPHGRAGVCGEAVTEKGNIKRIREITSVALRIHRDIPRYGRKIIDIYKRSGLTGTLVYSPPAMGKTTLLRSVSLMLARGDGIRPVKVGIADERCEIILPNTDLGIADVISGCKKSVAAEILTRTMSPEVIVCDEITPEDGDALIHSTGTGVYLICSCHAENKKDLFSKPHIRTLVENGCFKLLARVERTDGKYGYITETV